MHYKILIVFFFGLVCFRVDGLKCYSCTLTVAEGEENPDLTCVNSPGEVAGKPIITCPARMKFCTIVRNDYKSTGAVSSFERNCAEKPDIMNGDVIDDTLISHYRTCNTDLCNKGTGLESPNNGNQGEGGAMVVPGVKDNGVVTAASIFLITFLLLIQMI